MADEPRVAVLIDADNVSPRLAPALIAETATHGVLGIKRIYGDWTLPALNGWRETLAEHALQPVQQFAYTIGKNATDFALVIDAMDLLYAGQVDVFCIVAHDSDYTRLAVRLRESGKRVYGLGNKSASQAFQNACDRYTFLSVLEQDEIATEVPEDVAVDVRRGITAKAGDDGWAPLASVGWYLVSNDPTFDSRNHGFEKLSHLVRAVHGVETDVRRGPTGAGHVWVRSTESLAQG